MIRDISEEFQLPGTAVGTPAPDTLAGGSAGPGGALGGIGLDQDLRTRDLRYGGDRRAASVEMLDERMMRLEKSIVSVLSVLKKIVATPQGAATQPADNEE